MNDILCTYRMIRPGEHNACGDISVGMIRWTTQMSPGWTIQTTRAYCQTHIDKVSVAFDRAGQPYERLKGE